MSHHRPHHARCGDGPSPAGQPRGGRLGRGVGGGGADDVGGAPVRRQGPGRLRAARRADAERILRRPAPHARAGGPRAVERMDVGAHRFGARRHRRLRPQLRRRTHVPAPRAPTQSQAAGSVLLPAYRTLAIGFPFLTTGIILGALWATAAWGSVFAFDPLAMLSFVAWGIYAATLAGRAAAGWHGRRAAYFSIVGFVALVLTLGAGLYLPGRHGS